MTRDTVGKIASDLTKKSSDNTHCAYEQSLENLSGFVSGLEACVQEGLSRYPGSFYITVITKKERLMPNVLRNYFFSRVTCPTPDYDQTIYYYCKQREDLEYVWTIPNKQLCMEIVANPIGWLKEEAELVKFVMDFSDGTLFSLCLKRNGEVVH
jgi:hypothetical protein